MNRAPERPVRWPDRLAVRLLLVTLLVLLPVTGWLLLVVAPATGRALAAFGEATLQESSRTMHTLTSAQTEQSSKVLVDLIEHTTAARARALQDLPLEALGGDVAAIRAAIVREDSERSERQRRNVAVLAAEMRRRADRDIGERLQLQMVSRRAGERAFVRELSRTHLQLVAVTLTLLLVVLGFGMHRLVIRPTLRLRRATQRIANGELQAEVPAAGRGELGELTRDFGAMIDQLRQSRSELQRLADNLEVEVQRKTKDLESSHRQLAASERLASLGTLAGGIAHEFHNVIGGIRGCADELLADEQDPSRRETLAVVLRAAERGSGIVQQLQRFARQPAMQRLPVDAAAIAGEALALCEPAARHQQVEVHREFGDGCALIADPDLLHQVFVNLIVNALQAMPDGGALHVSARRSGDQVEVRVRDHGPGIPADALPHLFEPFFTTRADEPDPRRRGSGLGLSVSYGIVADHGGTIAATNHAAGGAEFVVRLPQAPAGAGR